MREICRPGTYCLCMKILPRLVAASSLISLLGLHAAEPAPDWENPALVGEGTEPPAATTAIFDDPVQALALKREKSPFFKSLNGAWKFHWVPKPADRPRDFWQTGFDDSAWKTIPVPANVEIEGHGIPIYSNIPYPWKTANPPFIPHDNNPVSSYRRTFTVPSAWDGRETYLTFDGVNSFFYLWVNGKNSASTRTAARPPPSVSRRI